MERLARAIEHTLLVPEVTSVDLLRICDEARRFGFAGVCLPSAHVAAAAHALRGTPVRVVTVVGFPLGCVLTDAKTAETRAAARAGAHEIDVVVHVGALREGDHDLVRADLAAVVDAADGRPVKAILETGILTDEEKRAAAAIALAAGCAYVKTSTGSPGRGGATVEDVALLRSVVGDRARIKASGGIRTREQALALLEAGADRLGTSAGPRLLEGGDLPSGASGSVPTY